MTVDQTGKLLRGIIVPTITPLTPHGRFDQEAMERLVERVIAGGVSGLFLAGTTGDGPALPLADRRAAVEVSCAAAAGRVAVVVAALETSVEEVFRTSEHAASCGANAIAIAPPFYLGLGEADIIRFGGMVDDRSALPAYLYNVPFANLPQFSVPVMKALADRPHILGLKDSSGNFDQLCEAVQIFASRPECSVLVGPERLLAASLLAGADGGVSGGANLFPALYAELYRSFLRGDKAQLQRLQEKVTRVERDFYSIGEPESSLVRGLKCGLATEGVCGATMAAPYRSPTPDEQAEVAARLDLWKSEAASVTPGML